MAISPHIARLRAAVGHDLLVLPSVAVLPVDGVGRLLLVQHSGDGERWGVLGGAVDEGESPAQAAIRETAEEIGVEVRLTRLVGVFGGPRFEVTYRNGDRVAYVPALYEAQVVSGEPTPDRAEIAAADWFRTADLPGLELNRFAEALLDEAGYLQR